MNRLSITGVITIFSSIAAMFFDCEIPADLSEDPGNAEVVLFTEKGNIGSGIVNIDQNDSSKIGLQMAYPKHFETVRITTSCGVYQKNVTPDKSEPYDTIYFAPVFTATGACTVFVNATLQQVGLIGKNDTLAFYVFAGQPKIDFVAIPQSLTTQTGRADTLLFVTKTRGGAGTPSYAVTATPMLDAVQLYALYSSMKDTVRVIFKPGMAGTYTVFINAIAPVDGAAAVNATTSVEIQVVNSLKPSIVDAPQTLVTGAVDTLVFVVDNLNRSDKLLMKLVTEQPLDPAVFTVLQTGGDSILIRVAPKTTTATGTVKIGIATSNGTLNDTAWYPIMFVDNNIALWNTINVAIMAVEGKPVRHDLRPYFIKQAGVILFTADIGTVADTVWQWTPTYGCEASTTATVTATKDATSSLGLKFVINVTPGDTTRPTLELVDKSLDGKNVSSPQIPIECVATDDGAGVGKVTFTYGVTTVEAVLQHDNIYSGVVAGLVNGKPTFITITATDKSIRKNSRVISGTIIYDSTMLDAEPPVIGYIAGPKSGERVKSAGGTIIYAISDNSGIDSVWWTLNGVPAGTITKQTNAQYVLGFSLTTYGNNTIVIHARDGSPNKNSGTTEVRINYNTVLSVVTIAAPLNNAIDISVEPTFTWTGGSDEDADTVYYMVSYGTAQNNLSIKSAEAKERSFKIAATDKLMANTTYYWKVVAYTKKPYTDTIETTVASFKTSGSAPVITTPLQAAVQVIEGTTLTLNIEASGIPMPTYQWYKNDTLLAAQSATEFNKPNVTINDAGSYHIVVANGIGGNVVSTKAVVTVRQKVSITQDPVAVTANEGGSAAFTVQATGESPLSYVWLRDGQPVNGATNVNCTLANVAPADDGKKYSCIVSNSFSKDTSSMALLTVVATPVYAVSFDVDGGSLVASQSIKSGGKATKPAADPTKDGFEFGGWYTSKTFATQFDFTTQVISAPCVVYAKWVVVYTVTYDKNGGSGSVPVDNKKYKSGDMATVLGNTGNLTRGGFVFSGWNTNSTGTGMQCDSGGGLQITGPVLLYARWKRLCSVTFDGEGATTAPLPASAGVKEGATVGTMPTGQAKTGYQFDGWWTGRRGTGTQVAATTVVNGDFVAYAKWIIRDIDNNTYTDVTIGSQTWVVENLKVTRYRDGSAIPNTMGEYYYWYNDNISNKDKYGALYTWDVVDPANTKKIAPAGWHVPTDAEWQTLQTFLIVNGYNFDGINTGNKIGKALASKTDWEYSQVVGNVGNTISSNNASGFTGLPAGYYYMPGFPSGTNFSDIGYAGYWWTSTESAPGTQYQKYYKLWYDSYDLGEDSMYKANGYSIRLIRDY